MRDAPLHSSVKERFALLNVQQYDVMAPYRPEALRGHQDLMSYYEGLPLPRVTCWRRITSLGESVAERMRRRFDVAGIALASATYPNSWRPETRMNSTRKMITPDSLVSCLGLLFAVVLSGAAIWVLMFWQIVPWLRYGVWHSYPLSWCFTIETEWIGLQLILDWLFRLPVTLILALLAIAAFWFFGLIASKLDQWASRRSFVPVTPAQTSA